MTIESATYIDGLNSSYPEANTAVSDGDNHLQLIKSVLKATFTGGSAGLSGAVTASHTELNLLDTAAAGTVVNSKAVVYSANGAVVGTNFGSTEYNAGNSSTAITINFNNGVNQKMALTGDVAVTLSNPIAGQTSKLKITTHASNTYTVTFSTTVLWPGGTAYTASATGSKVDFVTLYYDGSAWYGQFAKDFS